MEYSISIDKVVDIYTTLCPDGNTTDGRVFCRTAARVLERWLNKSKVTSDIDYEICYAAAAMANYRRVLRSSIGTTDFKAGDITVNDCSEKAVEYARLLYENALHAIGEYLKNRRFAFKGVKG